MGEVLKTVRTLIVPNQAVATYVTQWKYDSHNRLLEMIYPDEEKVTYGYNLGGQVDHVRGYKSYGYDYVNKIGYDKFEQRTYLKYCNGAETFYSYDPARRRLQNLVVNAKAGTIMDNAYSYDAVSNVLGVKNNAPLPQSGKAGGQMSHSYTYDPLYRLASATGTYKGTDNKSASYTLSMGYDNMHRITSKKQHLSQTGVQFDGTLNAGYDLTYTYQKGDGKKFQLDNVRDINYRTEETPTESTNINNGHKYTYDANGNLVYINTSRVKKDGKEDEKASEQKYRWDEENRLLAADENGFVSNYWYDADGERTVKTSGENEAIYVNSEFSGGNTSTARFSLYVSPYLVAGQGGKYTKHIYVGSQRIVSKLGDLASYGADPRRIPYAGNEADGLTINYKDKYNQQLQSIKDNYKTFDLPYNGQDNDDYVNGQGFCCNDGTPEAAQAKARTRAANGNFKPNDDYEKMQFYYHPDHLGSSSYITNLDGEVSQHIEYVPFGEVFIEERNNTWNTPYLFNAKEFDEETGMYYYGARYYEPRLSLWVSVDPKQEAYPNYHSYCYVFNNPVNAIDPDGNEPIKPQAGTAKGFVEEISNTGARSGRKHGQQAHNAMVGFGKIEFHFPRPLPANTGRINTYRNKYIYTTKGGWLDMAHFLYYAGKAYSYKLEKNKAKEFIEKHPILFAFMSVEEQRDMMKKSMQSPVGEAMQDGYLQEQTDRVFARHSAYSYEDLPSDKLGAEFGANYFDPKSKLSLGEQLNNYLQGLGATVPEKAPNYKDLPQKEPQKTPSRTNKTTIPVYTHNNP